MPADFSAQPASSPEAVESVPAAAQGESFPFPSSAHDAV